MNDIERIEKKLDSKFDSFQNFLNDLSVKIGKTETEIVNCKTEKKTIRKTLYGNGKDGLVLVVDRMHTKLKATGIMKRATWMNILTVFLCIGVVASIILGILSNIK